MPRKLHNCAVTFCEVKIPVDKLMCRFHWSRVPGLLRAEINSAWRALKIGGSVAMPRYQAARETAIKCFVEKEGIYAK